MPRGHPSYPQAFKAEAVRLVGSSDKYNAAAETSFATLDCVPTRNAARPARFHDTYRRHSVHGCLSTKA